MDTIRVYLDNMFMALPDNQKVREAKAELYTMMEDKYRLLKEEGKTENEAVGIVINEFGNLDEVSETLGITREVGQKKDIQELSHDQVVEGVEIHKIAGPKIGFGVLLIMIGVSLMMLTMGLQELEIIKFSNDQASYLGVSLLIMLVAAAVYQFIVYGMKLDPYEKYEKELVDISHESRTFLENVKSKINLPKIIASSVILFIITPVPIMLASFLFKERDGYILLAVALTCLMIGIGVYRIVKSAILDAYCEKLLQVGEYTPQKKTTKRKYDHIFAAYWMLAFVIYMLASFLTKRWDMTWLIWPVAGIIFGILNVLLEKNN